MPPLVPHPFSHRHAFRHTSGDDVRALPRSAEPFPPRCHTTCRPQRENCCVCSPSPLANGASRQEVLTRTLQGLSPLTRVGGHHHAKQQRASTPPPTSAPPPPPTAQALLAFSTLTPPCPPPSTSHLRGRMAPLAGRTRLMVPHVLPPPLVHGQGALHLPQRSSPTPTRSMFRHFQHTCDHVLPVRRGTGHAPRARRLLHWHNVPHPLAPAGALCTHPTHVRPLAAANIPHRPAALHFPPCSSPRPPPASPAPLPPPPPLAGRTHPVMSHVLPPPLRRMQAAPRLPQRHSTPPTHLLLASVSSLFPPPPPMPSTPCDSDVHLAHARLGPALTCPTLAHLLVHSACPTPTRRHLRAPLLPPPTTSPSTVPPTKELAASRPWRGARAHVPAPPWRPHRGGSGGDRGQKQQRRPPPRSVSLQHRLLRGPAAGRISRWPTGARSRTRRGGREEGGAWHPAQRSSLARLLPARTPPFPAKISTSRQKVATFRSGAPSGNHQRCQFI